MINDEELHLVQVAYHSMDVSGKGLVTLAEILKTFNAVEHPRVKEGNMAPSAAKQRVESLFATCAKEHHGCVTFSEFLSFHERLVEEAFHEKVPDVQNFIRETIMGIWRLGELLLPTGVRPAFPAAEPPKGLYASTLMTFVWVDRDDDGEYVLRGVKDVVRPHFARGTLPEEVQGLFAYPAELAGMEVQYLPSQVAMQSWLDFVWEYEEGKFCGVEGVISARLDTRAMPEGVRQFVLTHEAAVAKKCEFVKTQKPVNPMYKKSSDNYGYGVDEECRKLHIWKAKSLEGKQYGLQYHGLVGKYFAKMKAPMSSTAATGMNLK